MPHAASRALLEKLFDLLDWRALGDCYCEAGGAEFWDVHRGPALELGCQWADAFARRAARGGKSLWVGAGVAELPAMLVEVLELGRRAVAVNLLEDECRILNRGLRAAGIAAETLTVRAVDARVAAREGGFDHVALVSVFTDPDFWPTVGPATYGRIPPVLLDLAAFERERREIRDMVDTLCAALGRPAIVTTTVEEAPWFLHWADHHGVAVGVDDETIETAVIGDPIGFLALL